MNGKAPPDRDELTRTEGEGETLDMPEGMKGFTPGQGLGERYQVRSLLGRGGMGEVWHAFDLKLRVEVALKALRPEFFKSERRLELLRQEVRAAREVVSPNVCRIFDLIEVEGRELVSMEYVDGATLLGVLQERGPLELKEAQDIASQFLAGLEAIHKAGLIHRDIKPENIMLTRAGRVVVMDFGLARQEAEGGGTVSGTPAYMAPEQAAGQTLDARADVYAAGVVLAEMVCPEGIKSIQSRQGVWEGVRSEPAKVPDTPWAQVIKKAVAKDREGRYRSAHTLTRALEDVTLRVEGAEDLHPYPGLASFTESDAEYFFGREAEVEQMWRKLEGPPRMLALVGPSGAGKTSFLQAGLIPAARAGWAVIRCTPGTSPMSALREALASEMSGDAEAVKDLVRTDDPSATASAAARWRQGTDHALLIVDQFEELVTLNAEEDQVRFAALLHDLVLKADISVLLSMRDDFLMACHRHETLRPIVADLTLLHAPTGAALRRALTQPALQCGYRFEDDELVEEMLAEVEGERGALPLLAFAAARLWEKRDRETGLLTRQAYQDVGGVGGALARHAETTIDRVGHERLPVVRELFRNLVTAEGTRAVREWDDLLSVFCDSSDESQAAVLRSLIDARLLTSYEVREEDREPTRRVEIIHESLLANWPRLVRWQTQDADAAQLRDQLRQAAKTWDEHDRSDDMLWTGSAYREFAVWRERYPGGLSELEEAFASAMTSLATRRKRRRRIAVVAGFAVLLAVLAVFGTLWRRSVQETRRAEAEAAQREAAQLLALGQLQLASHPNAALAYTIASLETADNAAARRFALEALWRGPSALYLPGPTTWSAGWSPDGRWLALGGGEGVELLQRGHAGAIQLGTSLERIVGFTSDNRRVVTRLDGQPPTFHVRKLPAVAPEHTLTLPQRTGFVLVNDGLLTLTLDNLEPGKRRSIPVQLRTLDGTSIQKLGVWRPRGGFRIAVDPTGSWLYSLQDGRILQQPIGDLAAPGRVIGTHEKALTVSARPWSERVVTSDSEGEVRIWDTTRASRERTLRSSLTAEIVVLDPTGRFVAISPHLQSQLTAPSILLFDQLAPRHSEPTPLFVSGFGGILEAEFTPDGSWLSAVHNGMVVIWNLKAPRSLVLHRQESWVGAAAFSGAGDVFTVSAAGELRRHMLSSDAQIDSSEIWSPPRQLVSIGGFLISADGAIAVFSGMFSGTVFVVRLDGSGASVHDLIRDDGEVLWTMSLALEPSGRLLAVPVNHPREPSKNELRILDLVTGEERRLGTQPAEGRGCEEVGSVMQGLAVPAWLPDGRLLTDGDAGLRLWDLDSGENSLLRPCSKAHPKTGLSLAPVPGSQKILRLVRAPAEGEISSLSVFDLASGVTEEITSRGNQLTDCAVDASGTILVTVDRAGDIQVGPISGGKTHLLLGQPGAWGLAISPDSRSLVSTGDDGTLRLWPMPDLSKPPLHTLPHDELIAKLKSLTNLRAVRDPESSTGWKIEVGPFPGWADVPEW